MNERDPALDKAWRAHSRETPPPALDDAILAAAHRAVRSKPRPANDEPRWYVPLLAVAAIGAVAVGVVQLAPPEPSALDVGTAQYDYKPAAPAEAPKVVAEQEAQPKKQKEAADVAPVERPSAAGKVAAAPVPPPPRAPAAQEAPRENKLAAVPRPEPFPARPEKTEAFAGRDAPSVAADPTVPGAKRDSNEEARKDATAERQVAGAAAPPPPAAPAAAPALAQGMRTMEADRGRAQLGGLLQKSAPEASASEKARDPDAWIARIRKLRDAGQTTEALRELKEFRANVPDAEKRLPADLRDWKS